MKRISILLALTLSLSLLSACGGNEPAASTRKSVQRVLSGLPAGS